jgi:hypothetical protein
VFARETMSTAHLTLPPQIEIDDVERWRFDSLERAGYDREAATVIALSHDVDLHVAVGLLERGCPVDLALQILL